MADHIDTGIARNIMLQPGMEVTATPGEVIYTNAPYFEQYLGIWAMRDPELSAMAKWALNLNLESHLESAQALEAAKGNSASSRQQTVGIVELRGSLMKQRSSYGGGTSTAQARRAIRQLDRDPDIGSIVTLIDSPGGTVAGTRELAEDIRGTTKPIVTYFEDLGASAAYWIGSASDEVYANETAAIGSIGTFGVVYDSSEAFEMAGIKVYVVKAGEFKGMGTPGTEISAKQLEYLQDQVNAYNDFFVEAVMQQREMDRKAVTRVANGKTYLAEEALSRGLIDGIQTFDETIARAQELAAEGRTTVAATDSSSVSLTMEDNMSDTTQTVEAAAKPHEIKAACPDADDKFIVEQLMNEATLAQAKDAYLLHVKEQADAREAQLKAELEEARKQQPAPTESASPAPATATVGVSAVPLGASTGAGAGALSAKGQYDALWQKYKAEGLKPLQIAERIDREYPDLRLQMLRDANDDPNWEERRPPK